MSSGDLSTGGRVDWAIEAIEETNDTAITKNKFLIIKKIFAKIGDKRFEEKPFIERLEFSPMHIVAE